MEHSGEPFPLYYSDLEQREGAIDERCLFRSFVFENELRRPAPAADGRVIRGVRSGAAYADWNQAPGGFTRGQACSANAAAALASAMRPPAMSPHCPASQ